MSLKVCGGSELGKGVRIVCGVLRIRMPIACVICVCIFFVCGVYIYFREDKKPNEEKSRQLPAW